MVKLEIFVVDNCWSCEESHRIAAEAKLRFADEVEVALRDLERDPHPITVFAAPTYVLDGNVISLGNPRREELWARLAQRVKENGT
ncbi:MAG: hypothetical protein RRC07_00435 [Anaerolineae bacterium]|nr:hypothetical protein [Anaerolineae bacterium]